MIDLHTHILFEMDDGAKSIEESITLLQMELDSGIHTVALTPHCIPAADRLEKFFNKRNEVYTRLVLEVKKQKLPVNLILGAEVAFTPQLLELDVDKLCYEGTKTILVELPMSNYPPFVQDVFYKLLLEGYTPLIAHTERYPYFAKNPQLLEKLVDMGAHVQINAGPLTRKLYSKRRLFNLISDKLVHCIASDTHGVELRPPKLGTAVKVIEKKLGAETAQRLVNYNL